MRTGADTGPCARCSEPNGARYRWREKWVCWLCLPARWRREPAGEKFEPPPYAELVDHVWTRLAALTSMPVFYLEPGRIAAHCPVCLDGVLTVRFLDGPARFRVASPAGEDRCSDGCPIEHVAGVLE